MPTHTHTVRCLFCLALLVAVGGCAEHSQQPAALKLPPPKPQRVDFANLGAHTSAVDATASVNADELLARIAALQKQENAPARVQRLVQRFPDAALDVLRDTAAAQASQPERTAAAVAYDRAFIAAGSVGWTKTFVDATKRSGEYETIHQARLSTLRLIDMGRPELVFTQVHFPAESGFPFAEADMLRLRGIAALLSDRTADALRAWHAAEELARADRGVCAELRLLEAEALRHDGAAADADARWSAAATSACTVRDPSLWQRLIEARSESAQWPAAVADYFSHSQRAAPAATLPVGSTSPAQVEACIWREIGEWRFSRMETPAALLAFKQAEPLFDQPRERAEARISQARALLTMNQSGAAISILTSLTTDPDPLINHHALAVLGNARIALDDVPGALTLLQSAVANDDSFPASLRAPARADLGLVFLLSSREQDGLKWLHEAQADFESDHDCADLVQCLRNEAAYLDQIGRTEQAQDIRDRASRVSAIY